MCKRLHRCARVAFLTFLAACDPGTGETPPNAPGSPTPNVILITIDTLRADAIGFAGYARDTTPELDRFAETATVFLGAMTSFQGTSPSMPSLMSGRFPSFLGVKEWTRTTNSGFFDLRSPGERPGVPRNLEMLAESLRAWGYATAGFTTNPNLTRRVNFDQGFQHFEEFQQHLYEVGEVRTHALDDFYPSGEVVVNHVLRWLDDRAESANSAAPRAEREEPLFLWVHFMDVHSPYLPPPPYDRMFRAEGPGANGPYTDATDLEINEALYNLLSEQVGHVRGDDFANLEDLALDREMFKAHLRALYDGSIGYVDAEFGRLLKGLEERGLRESSILIVTSDHGEEFFEHGNVIHHRLTAAAEELFRIPLVIAVPAGVLNATVRRTDALVRMVDIAPTVLDLAGFESTDAEMLDGVSLRPVLEGRTASPQTAFVNYIDFGVARTERWKYRRTLSPTAAAAPQEQLFAIESDPLELRDVALEHPAVLERIRAEYDAFEAGLQARRTHAAIAPVRGEALDPELRRRLEALGYVGEE